MLALLQKIQCDIGLLFKLKSYLNTNNLINVLYSLVVSHLRYCIRSWNHGNKTLVQNLGNLCKRLKNISEALTAKVVICYPLKAYIS